MSFKNCSLEDTHPDRQTEEKKTQNFKFTQAATASEECDCSWVLKRNNELKYNKTHKKESQVQWRRNRLKQTKENKNGSWKCSNRYARGFAKVVSAASGCEGKIVIFYKHDSFFFSVLRELTAPERLCSTRKRERQIGCRRVGFLLAITQTEHTRNKHTHTFCNLN